MKNDKLIPGLVLVLIGATFLLDNFGYIDFHWSNIIYLWPIFLIIGGVNLVFANNHSHWASILKISVVILGFIILVFGDFSGRSRFPFYFHGWHHHHHRSDNNDMDDDDNDTINSKDIVKVEGSSTYSQPYAADAQYAQLNISGGGTGYELNDTTNQLFQADTKEFFGKYEFGHHKDGATYVLDFKMKDNKGHFDWDDKDDKSNSAVFKLNVNPIWDMRVESGATALNFDLSKFKVRSFTLKGGAGSFDVKFGQPLQNTTVNISAGVSSVDITIPESAACDIESNTGLASNSFDGFDKKDNGHYQTPGFASAKNKMYITISGGVGSFDVHRQ